MNNPTLTVTRPPGVTDAAGAARELAARIQVPRRLPPRYDGEPLMHLSHSSYQLFLACPEQWRRRYLKGERSPTTGAMFLGSQVDHALTTYYQQILDHHDRLTLDQLTDAYRQHFYEALDETDVAWEDGQTAQAVFKLGADALALTLTELVPQLGEPVAVQRRMEYALAPELQWTVLCYPDLETIIAAPDGEPVAAVVDFKVKKTPLTQFRAEQDTQPTLYLAGRWLAGDPAQRFTFAQIAKPGPRRVHMRASLISTTRSAAQLRGMLARIAQAAALISACYERLGPDQPWAFADPTSWKCQPRYCDAWPRCPGGAGLT